MLKTYLVHYRDTQLRTQSARPVEAKDENDAKTQFRIKYGYAHKAITKVEKY